MRTRSPACSGWVANSGRSSPATFLNDVYQYVLGHGANNDALNFWGGYLLEPDAVEFWQAGAFRLHDRLRYRRVVSEAGEVGGGWAVDRLSP